MSNGVDQEKFRRNATRILDSALRLEERRGQELAEARGTRNIREIEFLRAYGWESLRIQESESWHYSSLRMVWRKGGKGPWVTQRVALAKQRKANRRAELRRLKKEREAKA